MAEDVYEAGAEYYDSAYAVKTDLVDQVFYVDLATSTGGPVLELGCGTGRITIPIAERGIDVTGVDASASMLQVLRGKLDRSRADEHDNPLIVHGDMRDLSLGRKFKLVINEPVREICGAAVSCTLLQRPVSECVVYAGLPPTACAEAADHTLPTGSMAMTLSIVLS